MPQNSVFHIREPKKAGRLELLDFLRGAGMLLVLLHHSEVPKAYWILAFHMPLLFLLSGYTVSRIPLKARFADFLRSRFLRLMIPYFLFEGINLLVWSLSLFLQGGWQDVSEAVTAIVSCVNTEGYTGYYGRLWFWPCMFVSDMFFYCVLQYSPRSKKARYAFQFGMIPVLFGISWVTCRILPGRLPFTVDTAIMATGFLLTGYLLGPQITWLLEKKHPVADCALLLVTLTGLILCVSSGKTDFLMFINLYGHYGLSICAAYCGSIAFLILSKWLYSLCVRADFLKSLVLWYGYHSLGTFPMHLSVKMMIYYLLPLSCRKWYILLPAMLILNIPLVNFITRYLPFLLGSFPKPAPKTKE